MSQLINIQKVSGELKLQRIPGQNKYTLCADCIIDTQENGIFHLSKSEPLGRNNRNEINIILDQNQNHALIRDFKKIFNKKKETIRIMYGFKEYSDPLTFRCQREYAVFAGTRDSLIMFGYRYLENFPLN